GLNRLTGLSNRHADGSVINEFAYTYGPQDLRASETASNSPAVTLANQRLVFSYNQLNQVLTSAPPTLLFAYDADGNQTRGFNPTGLAFTAAYDAENRLKSLTLTNNSGHVLQTLYDYRGSGLLARTRQYDNGQLSNDSHFVSDGFLVAQERDGANNIVRQYAWGRNRGGGIGGLLTLTQAGQSYVYFFDGKGNVTTLADATEVTAVAYSYDPFGVLTTASGSLQQPFRFSTKLYDETTGLSYFG